jgi:hypothetical protein
MKKIYFIFSIFIISMSMVLVSTPGAHSNSSGGPSGNTGSPGDGFTCQRSGCHNGTAQSRAGLITSNVPASGYLPGTTYTITVTLSEPGINRFGFQVSPQSPTGTLLGTLISTDGPNTQLVGGGKYITHRNAGTQPSSTNTRTWTFDWIAPDEAAATFYGSMMASNNNGNNGGDQVFTSSLALQRDISSSVNSNLGETTFTIFPNPMEGNSLRVRKSGMNKDARYELYQMDGKRVEIEVRALGYDEVEIISPAFETGVYVLKVEVEGTSTYHRIIRK